VRNGASWLAAAWLAIAGPAAGAETEDVRVLRRHGITPDARSIGAYLKTLYPDESSRRHAARLAARLGEEDAQRRDLAKRRLAQLRTMSLLELQRASRSPDPDVRRSASRILESALSRVDRQVLAAALRTVEDQEIRGLARDLLHVTPLAEALLLRPEAERALQVTTRPEDADLLRAVVLGTEPGLRPAAVFALGAALAGESLHELRPLLVGPDPRVRLAAAWALSDNGDRDGLATFVDLLADDDPWIRDRAARALRHVSGKTFRFSAFGKPADRAGGIRAWRRWIETDGPHATWERPLPLAPRMLGRTLVTAYTAGRVFELDSKGRTVWEKRGVPTPWAAQGLRNGHRLVALYQSKAIVEYDENGREVWRREGLPGLAGSVRRLPNGNTLLAFTNPDRLVELRPGGGLAWELALPGRPTDAQRLRNGRILVTLGRQGTVAEIDRRGKRYWTITGLRNPYSASRLENGNTLVCEFGAGRVREYTRDRRIVWELSGLSQCYTAQRLPNGRTLIADRKGVREVEKEKGKVVWLTKGGNYLRAYRY